MGVWGTQNEDKGTGFVVAWRPTDGDGNVRVVRARALPSRASEGLPKMFYTISCQHKTQTKAAKCLLEVDAETTHEISIENDTDSASSDTFPQSFR